MWYHLCLARTPLTALHLMQPAHTVNIFIMHQFICTCQRTHLVHLSYFAHRQSTGLPAHLPTGQASDLPAPVPAVPCLSSEHSQGVLNRVTQHLKFCSWYSLQPVPAHKHTMAFFASALSRLLSPKTIWVYISSVATIHNHMGLPDPTSNNAPLHLTL